MSSWSVGGRRLVLAALVAVAAAAFAIWRLDGFAMLGQEAVAVQRALQNWLARGVAGVRGGEPFALATLMGAAALYGLAHAAGPGHGKALMAAAAAGTRAGAGRLALIAVLGSLAQGLTAVLVVYGGLWLVGGARALAITRSDAAFAPAGHAMLALLGLWLLWRGGRALLRPAASHGCGAGCGHDHGPDPALARDADWRMALGLILATAARPCGGAMLTLALAWGAGAPVAGVLATLAMAAGTAVVTSGAAAAAAGARQAAAFAAGPGFARAAGLAQALVGVLAAALGAAGLAATL
ncbi:nickel/cobalt transporter [Rubrimonas cliftonensis]|uniref:Nickel/cobalt efflux system n=1 Tax=Rubrimonas cliftonensis TaxID=89524 RepID=A0A1H3W423_9RHOB|nr:hypothetical protein [Rubrimonas cliftonensis]SDZ81184.1 ABC-type nickel/cobalt efflux system, permease component RcnA [Rubrimonas cliftonensis]